LRPRKICVLGSTGTIGQYTLELVEKFPQFFQVASLAAGNNVEKLRTQIRKFNPERVSVLTESAAGILQQEFPRLEVSYGESGIESCIEASSLDVVIVGIVGFAGLKPTLHAIRKNLLIGLANKESLVTGGTLLREELKKHDAKIIPVDSEHNALFQLLSGVKLSEVSRLVLTASGGPFFKKTDLDLSQVTPEMATAHPNWKMGPKISVDSASLMNKGLELIEAHYLFNFSEKDIEVWIHPQSIVHGAVWLKDNTSLSQLSVPDMKSAIGYALSYPERLSGPIQKLTLSQMSKLEFFEPDNQRFPCLALARKALIGGPGSVIALNAANEIAVEAFLSRKITFQQIPQVIDAVLQKFTFEPITELDLVFEADRQARVLTQQILKVVG